MADLRVPTSELRVRVKEKEGRITTKGRRALGAGQFGLPDGNRPGVKGRYPIDKKERARNALARSAQAVKAGRMTKRQRAILIRRIRAKWPDIEVSE